MRSESSDEGDIRRDRFTEHRDFRGHGVARTIPPTAVRTDFRNDFLITARGFRLSRRVLGLETAENNGFPPRGSVETFLFPSRTLRVYHAAGARAPLRSPTPCCAYVDDEKKKNTETDEQRETRTESECTRTANVRVRREYTRRTVCVRGTRHVMISHARAHTSLIVMTRRQRLQSSKTEDPIEKSISRGRAPRYPYDTRRSLRDASLPGTDNHVCVRVYFQRVRAAVDFETDVSEVYAPHEIAFSLVFRVRC